MRIEDRRSKIANSQSSILNPRSSILNQSSILDLLSSIFYPRSSFLLGFPERLTFEHLDTKLQPIGFLAALNVGCGSARADALLCSGRAQETGLVFGDVRDADGGVSGFRRLWDAGANG